MSRVIEADFRDELHPRNRFGQWIDIPGLPSVQVASTSGPSPRVADFMAERAAVHAAGLPEPVARASRDFKPSIIHAVGVTPDAPGPDTVMRPEHFEEITEGLRAATERFPEISTVLSGFRFRSSNLKAQMLADPDTGLAIAVLRSVSDSTVEFWVNDGPDVERGTFLNLIGAPHNCQAVQETLRGAVTHEAGHMFQLAHGGLDESLWGPLLAGHDLTPDVLAQHVSLAAAAMPSEGFAELFAQQFTPGYQIEDEQTREHFLQLIAEIREGVL